MDTIKDMIILQETTHKLHAENDATEFLSF